mmetsp:Transcript_115701/g.367919  ORF Transcript_115701/g.367919 Transcript_115701/m.367919 type:complete len:124 (-) Transcript_115701:312-683(-)
MAADEENDDEEEEVKLTGQAAAQAKQLDSLTDFVEDGEGSKVDATEVQARLNDLRKSKEAMDRQLVEHQKQLQLVKFQKEDLDLMCSELPLCEKEALERVLRENDGDLVKTLAAVVRRFPTSS